MNVKYVLCFLAGLGVGGAGGYLVARKQLQKKSDQALDEITTEFTSTLKKSQEHANQLEQQLRDWNRTSLDLDYDVDDDYESHSEDPEEPTAMEEAEAPEEPEYGEMDIYAIGIADFMQDANYDKEYLIYYRGNNCFTYSDDSVVDDPRKLLGDMVDMVDIFQGEVMYVRNTRTNVDYQVDFDEDAFDGGE